MGGRCTVCGALIKSGGARGLCARCYQRERRNMPPSLVPEKAPHGEGDQVTFRLDRSIKQAVRDLAVREDMTESDWYRMAVLNQIKRSR